MPRRSFRGFPLLMDELVSVEHWGAVGDGVADDTTAFQTAIDKLDAAGGVIYVPEGNFIVTAASLNVGSKTVFWLLNGQVNTSYTPSGWPGTIINATAVASTDLPLAGGTMTGAIVLSGDGTIGLNPASKQQMDVADALKANIASPTFTGVPAADTAGPGTNTTQLANTAFVAALGALKATLTGAAFTGAVTFAGGVRVPETTLTDGANIAWDARAKQTPAVTLAGNRTLDNPTNMDAGATYILRVTQDGTGTRTLAYGTAYKWPGGIAPVLSTAINSVDIITFVSDGTSMYGAIQKAFA